MGRAHEVGTLRPRGSADITVFRVKEGPVTYTDSQGHTEQGTVDLEPIYTVRAGRVVKGPGVSFPR